MMDPVWAYWVVFGIAVSQVFLISSGKDNHFLLVHYVTVLIYFSAAPAMQIASNSEFWGVGIIGGRAHREAFLLLLAYLCGIELASVLWSGETAGAAATARMPVSGLADKSISGIGKICLLTCSALAFGAMFIKPDLNFVPRGIITADTSRPLELLLYSMLPKTTVLLAFSVFLINLRNERTVIAFLAMAGAFGFACVAGNPVTTPRQIILIGLMPVAMHFLMQRWAVAFSLLTFLSVAGIGPFFNFISRGTFYDVDLDSFPMSADFDAMYVVAGLLERAPAPEAGMGRYLLSAISFMLPRDFKLYSSFDPLQWNSVDANFSQSNLSLPPFMPAFLDFGYLGPVLLGLAIARLFQKIQSKVNFDSPLQSGHLFALVAMATYVPFLRGPILGWGPFATSGVVAICVLAWLANRTSNFKREAIRPYSSLQMIKEKM